MATKPKKLDTNIDSVNALNAIRNDIGGAYAAAVPVAYAEGQIVDGQPVSKERALQRLRDIGEVVTSYQAHTNAFFDQLVNRIAYTLISSRLYRNSWGAFKRGFMELGETVEEVFVNLASAHQFDPEVAETEVYKRELPDVRAAFHTMNYQKFYKVTISRSELRMAFLTFDGLNNLISKIIETLYTAANYDEFLMMKYLIAKNALSGHMATHTIPVATLKNADQIVSSLRMLSQDVQYMSTNYNFAGVTTYSDMSSQYLILSNAFSSIIDVGSLARAYNLDKAELLSRTIGVNNFQFTAPELKRLANLIFDDGSLEVFTEEEQDALSTIQGILIDKDWFMIFDNEDFMDAQKNAQGLYFNHFYHVWKTFSSSPFNTAVVLTSDPQTVTGVAVEPPQGTAKKNTQTQFSATVTGTPMVNKGVTWTIDSNVSKIDNRGVVTVSGKETKASLTVTATSVADPTKTATATLTIE